METHGDKDGDGDGCSVFISTIIACFFVQLRNKLLSSERRAYYAVTTQAKHRLQLVCDTSRFGAMDVGVCRHPKRLIYGDG